MSAGAAVAARAAPAPPDVEVKDVVRAYGTHVAVGGVSFALRRGDVTAFVGENGAGKSTLLRMLAGVSRPTKGSIAVFGHPAHSQAARAQVGFLSEHPAIDADLVVEEQLQLVAALRGLARAQANAEVARVLHAVDLLAVRYRLCAELSKGMQGRVGLAQALVGDPPVLLLDEPTAGLDPAQVHAFQALVRAQAADHAILLSTHLVGDVVAACDRVLVLHQGRIVLDETLAGVRARGPSVEATLVRLLSGGA